MKTIISKPKEGKIKKAIEDQAMRKKKLHPFDKNMKVLVLENLINNAMNLYENLVTFNKHYMTSEKDTAIIQIAMSNTDSTIAWLNNLEESILDQPIKKENE